eukprot:g2611.t1
MQINWVKELGVVLHNPVELKKLATPNHNTRSLLPYSSTSVCLDAQVQSCANVSNDICRMSPQKERFANVLRMSQASGRAHKDALLESLANDGAAKNNWRVPTRPKQSRASTRTSPRRQKSPERLTSVAINLGDQPENKSFPISASVDPKKTRRPTFSQVEYKSLKPTDRVRLRYKAYRDNPALAKDLQDRTRKIKFSAKMARRRERERHAREWGNNQGENQNESAMLDDKIAAARKRYWQHWQIIMDERVASRDRFSPENMEKRLQKYRVQRLLIAVALGARAQQQRRRLRAVRRRRERWESCASESMGNDPVLTAVVILQRWFRWSPKPFVRKKWLEKYGGFYLKQLADYRVSRAADDMFAFLRDLNRRLLGYKTKCGRSIDLKQQINRFHRQVRLVQRCIRRFTLVRNARLALLEKKWEQAEWEIAKERRDEHVTHLRFVRDEERRMAREREKVALECELASIANINGDIRNSACNFSDTQSTIDTDNKDTVDENPGTDTYRPKAGTRSFKLEFSDSKGDGLTSERRNRMRRRESLSSAKARARQLPTTARRGTTIASASKMKSLMENQLSQAMRPKLKRRDDSKQSKSKPITSKYKTRRTGKRHCAQTYALARMTTEELAALLAKSLDKKDGETVKKVLEVVDGEHDDLDTPSGGFAIEDFLERVAGDLRRDAIVSWLQKHLRRSLAHCERVHQENIDEWREKAMRISVEDSKRLFVETRATAPVDEDGTSDNKTNESEEEDVTWTNMKSMLERNHINLNVRAEHGEVNARPKFPPVLLLTGPCFDAVEFRTLVQNTLDHRVYG